MSSPFLSKLKKKHEGYIGSLIADLTKESKDAKVDEDHSQQEHEVFIAESAASRAAKAEEVEELKDTRAS